MNSVRTRTQSRHTAALKCAPREGRRASSYSSTIPSSLAVSRAGSVEGGVLVRNHRRLVVLEVVQRVLPAVVVLVIVLVQGLRFQASHRVELLYLCRAQPRQSAVDGTLYLCRLRVLDGVDERLLRLSGVDLKLLGGVLLPERRNRRSRSSGRGRGGSDGAKGGCRRGGCRQRWLGRRVQLLLRRPKRCRHSQERGGQCERPGWRRHRRTVALQANRVSPWGV